jgi:hypothetical protein
MAYDSSIVGLCSRALALIGEPAITSLSPTTTAAEEVCNLLYADTLEAALVCHPWRFTCKKAKCSERTYDFTWVDSSLFIIIQTHAFLVGDVVKFTAGAGTLPTTLSANTKYYVVDIDVSGIKVSLTPPGPDQVAILANVPQGGVGVSSVKRVPLDTWSNALDMPDDILKPIHVDVGDFEIYRGKVIYSNHSSLILDYQYKVTELDLPPWFVSYFTYKLASEFAIAITEQTTRAQAMRELAEAELRRAKHIDSRQRTQVAIMDDAGFVTSRYGGYQPYSERWW